MKNTKISTLQTYEDWLEKAKHEYVMYQNSCGIYDLANCFLTLPEWIAKSDVTPPRLKDLAIRKIEIMKGDKNQFQLDEEKLGEIDHQLRLVRIFCNHSKHRYNKEKLDKITLSTIFPITFPVKFDHLMVGNKNVQIGPTIHSVLTFWEGEIDCA